MASWRLVVVIQSLVSQKSPQVCQSKQAETHSARASAPKSGSLAVSQSRGRAWTEAVARVSRKSPAVRQFCSPDVISLRFQRAQVRQSRSLPVPRSCLDRGRRSRFAKKSGSPAVLQSRHDQLALPEGPSPAVWQSGCSCLVLAAQSGQSRRPAVLQS